METGNYRALRYFQIRTSNTKSAKSR